MTDLLSNLAANNVLGAELLQPAVQPRLRARFEPSSLAETPLTAWETGVAADAVERAPEPRHAVHSRVEAEIQPSPRDELPALGEERPGAAPRERRIEQTVTRLQQYQEIVERVERSTDVRIEETIPPPGHEVHLVGLPPEPQQTQASARTASPEPMLRQGTTESAAQFEQGHWIVRPQTTRAEAHAQSGAPLTTPSVRSDYEPAPGVSPPPPIQVTIGRVEVRATIPAAPNTPPRPRHVREPLSLEDYLRGSGKR